MSISFQTIEWVIALQRLKSISKTAQSLYISEPALSKKIKKTEDELGYALIERTNNGCMLTNAGAILAEQGKELLKRRDAILSEMEKSAASRTKQTSVLRLGIANCYAETILPKFLPEFVMQHPDVKVELLINRTDILERMCIDGQVDLIVTQMESNDYRLEYAPIMKEETVLYIPAKYTEIPELSDAIAAGVMPLNLLKNYPHAEVQGHARFISFAEPLYAEAEFKPQTVFRSESWPTILTLIEQGMCYTVMPDIFAVSPELVRMVHIQSKLPTHRTIALAWQTQKELPAQFQQFIRLTQELLS